MVSFGVSRTVSTNLGLAQGKRILQSEDMDRPVDAFYGIPYARPPVGPLRFKKPEPAVPWDGVRDATNWPATSLQLELPFPGTPAYVQSENCLYLNVFTPTWTAPTGNGQSAPTASGFPVMVYIHGGGYVRGKGDQAGDIGVSRLLVSKDVIVVSIQYRLGYLGFWTTEDGSIPSNLGLWDQTLALKWVQENIGAFGGDEGNVTLIGLSSGGASVDLLTLSPHTNYLFNRIIAMCGSAHCSWATNSKERQLKFCADKVEALKLHDKTPDQIYDALMAVDAAEFSKAVNMDTGNGFHLAPVVDGEFFPEPLEQLRRKAPAIPVITGVSSSEAAIFGFLPQPTRQIDDVKNLLEIVLNSKETGSAKEAVTNFYNIDDTAKCSPAKTQFLSDAFFNASALHVAQEVATHKKDAAPVYLYLFEYFNPETFDLLPMKVTLTSSTHGAEMTSTFGKGFFNATLNEDDWKMASIWSRLLVNFAAYGNPNGSASDPESKISFEWPRLTEEHKERHLNVTLSPSASDSFLEGRPAHLLQIIKEHRLKN